MQGPDTLTHTLSHMSIKVVDWVSNRQNIIKHCQLAKNKARKPMELNAVGSSLSHMVVMVRERESSSM